jgi:lysophospholipase L1-like esterase
MDTIVTPVTVITLDSTRIVHSIKADLVARYFPPVVRLVQYDMSLPVIAVSLMQNGQTYTLPSGAAANIRVHKPDATYVYNPALGCDSTRNIVYFEVTQAMAAANGDGLAIVEIVVDGDIAGTSLITLHFEENPVPEDAIESSDEWETIYELGERIIASTVTPVSTAAGMTDHNVVYLYTGTESGWNQGHMYYYNGTTWVDAGIAVTDKTLTVEGLAADAKKTGEEIADLKDGLTAVESDVTDLKEDLTHIEDGNVLSNLAELVNYTIKDGVMQFQQNTINTSNTAFKRIEYTLEGETLLYVAGYSYSAGYALWGFLDGSDNVISYKKNSPSNTVINGEFVTVPNNAVKIVVNIRIDGESTRAYYIFKYSDNVRESLDNQLSQNIFVETIDYPSILHYGVFHRIDGTETSGSGYEYREATLSGGERLVVSGRNAGSNHPLITLYDANDNIIYRVVSNGVDYKNDTNYINRLIIAPANARKIIVNGYSLCKAQIKQYTTKRLNDCVLDSNVIAGDMPFALFPADFTLIDGNVVKIDGTTGANTWYEHAEMSVSGGEDLYVTGRHYSMNYPLYIIYNSNGAIMNIFYGTGDTNYSDVHVKVPTGADKIIVNGIKASPAVIKTFDTSLSLAKYIASEGTLTTYDGSTPVSALMSTAEIEQKNVEYFSRAYAVMLHKIMTNYPTSKIACCTIQACERTTGEVGVPERNTDKKTLADYNAVIRKLADAFGCIVVDHNVCGITYYNLDQYMSDYASSTGFGLHPNAAGMALLAEQTVHALKNYDFAGKTFSVFGDSISTYDGTGSTNNEYPKQTDVNDVSKTWWYKSLVTGLGMTFLTNASGGGRSVSSIREGISDYPKSGYNTDAISRIGETSPDLIIIKLGVNDFGNVGSSSNRNLSGEYIRGGL